jgi:hypothetical protein
VLLLVFRLERRLPAQDELARELEWLERSLVAAERDPRVSAVILVGHAPPYTNAAVHSRSTFVREQVLGRAAKHARYARSSRATRTRTSASRSSASSASSAAAAARRS